MKNKDVFTNIETLDILKNGRTLLRVRGDELNGLNISQIEELIGQKIGEGTYNFSKKIIGQMKKVNGKIRGVVEHSDPKKYKNDTDNSYFIHSQIKDLNDKLEKAINNNHSSDYKTVIDIQKASYEAQLSWYHSQNKILSDKIEKLEAKIESLDGQDNNSGLSQILTLIPAFLKAKGSSGVLKDNLASDTTDIPGEFTSALGQVDWSKISEGDKEKVLNYFNMFKSQLPLKEVYNG